MVAAEASHERGTRRRCIGRRGRGATIGDGIRVWPWAVVLDWFRESLKNDLGERGVAPEVAALVDACLAGKIGSEAKS